MSRAGAVSAAALGTGPAPRGRAGPWLSDARVRCSRWPGARTSRQPSPASSPTAHGVPLRPRAGPRRAPQVRPGRRGPRHLALHPLAPGCYIQTHTTAHTHTNTHTPTHTAVPEGQAWSELTIHIRLGKWCIPVIEWKPSPTLQNQVDAQPHDRRLTRPRKL